MNKILKIGEINVRKSTTYEIEYNKRRFMSGMDYTGYRVETEKGNIDILIEDESQCYEEWGYMTSDDNLDYFIGAELKDVSIVSDGDKKILSELEKKYEFRAEFVEFKTDKGIFQIAVYNAHNGYYSHKVVISFYDKDVLLTNV